MSVRPWIIGLVVMTGFVAAPSVRAGEFDKYLPPKSELFVQINVPKLFSSDLVRTAFPMAVDKYSEQLMMFAGMAKQMNPNAPDVPEEKMKEAFKKLSDPKEIAQAFDIAKTVVSDVVIAGSAAGDTPQAVILIKSAFIKAPMVEMIANLVAAQPQVPVQIQKIKKSGGMIYAITQPQDEHKIYLTVPEEGVLHLAMSEELAEASFAPSGKPSDKLAALMAKRDPKDFVFTAAIGDDDADFTTMAAHLVLDKDIAGQFSVDFKDAAKAKQRAEEANEHLSNFIEQIKMMLSEKGAEAAKTHLGKTKAEVDGTNVKASLSIPGAVIEELLKKEKE